MGRKPLPARKKQLNVALDDSVRQRLETLADKAGRSLADEVRQRLERTLNQDAAVEASPARRPDMSIEAEVNLRLVQTLSEDEFDEPTQRLGAWVMVLARDASNRSAWYASSKSHAVLVEAIRVWLEAHKPSPGADHLWGSDDPAVIGRTIANLHLRHEQMEVARRRQGPPATDRKDKSKK